MSTVAASGIMLLISGCGGSVEPLQPATNLADQPPSTTTLPEAATVATTAPPTTEASTQRLVLAQLDDSLRLRAPDRLGTAEQARWLFEQLPVERLVVDTGPDSSTVSAIDGDLITEITTDNAFTFSDGSYIFIDRSTPGSAERRVRLGPDHGYRCQVPASKSWSLHA